jgi:hypothetical protein
VTIVSILKQAARLFWSIPIVLSVEKKKNMYLSWQLLLDLPFLLFKQRWAIEFDLIGSSSSISSLKSRYFVIWYDKADFCHVAGHSISNCYMQISKIYLIHYFPSTNSFVVPLFLPDFCQFDFENEPAEFRPDRTEPDRLLNWPDQIGYKKSVRFQLWYHVSIML